MLPRASGSGVPVRTSGPGDSDFEDCDALESAGGTPGTQGSVVFDCLATGLRRLRSHRALVALLWLETLLVVLLTLGGLALPLAAVDFEPVHALVGADLHDFQRWFLWLAEDAVWTDFVPRSPVLIAALVGLAVLWTAALFVYCWFQAGLYGVLVEGASGDGVQVTSDARTSFELHRFVDHGRRGLWRFFGLIHLFVLYLTGVMFLWLWVVWLAVWGWVTWGDLALLGIGFGGMSIVGFLTALLVFWFLLARADLAQPSSGVRRAQRRGWAVLRRRPGAVTVLGLLFLALGAVAAGLPAPVSVLAGRVLDPWSGAWWVVRCLIEMTSWALYAAVAVFVGGATVALMVPTEAGAA